jgi:antitoxin component of RelBE/YafQ-DinJ toxin-antitoxin module
MVKSKKKASAKPLKDEMVRFRVSAEQKEAFEDAAKRDGLDVSAWLRQLALRASGVLPEAK